MASTSPVSEPPIVGELRARFGDVIGHETAVDGIPTVWTPPGQLLDVLAVLKHEVSTPYRMLFDLTGIDERLRATHNGDGAPKGELTAVYHLLCLEPASLVRVKVALPLDDPRLPSATPVYPAANWYEREAFDMLGIHFEGHPHLTRILMPRSWVGHPLRKDHPARGTEMGPYVLPEEKEEAEHEALRFRPEEWGLTRKSGETEFLFLNVGPQHPGTHGVLRIVLQLDGEEIVDAIPEIGFHHRAAEKMGERQTWHTFIPYTDRVDYLAGLLNNLAYLMSVEKLAGIVVPPRAQVVRVMMCELWRIASHLVWYGTFAQDLGQMSPVFYMFNDRERFYRINEAVTGFRMHPAWFRIGGLAADLPRGWDGLVRDFLDYLPARLRQYDAMVLRNALFKARTKGIGAYTADEAIEWSVTGAGLRACGVPFDLRRAMPYAGYEQYEFDIPVAVGGDAYARAEVRVAEMRQSLRIVRQCLDNMPEGPIKADHPLTTPPIKDRTMRDIETLINHFVNVTWGPAIPPGEAMVPIENAKGANGYYAISDGNVQPYRMRIRSPSFPHMQMLPLLARGLMVPDLLSILGSMDFVLADVDR